MWSAASSTILPVATKRQATARDRSHTGTAAARFAAAYSADEGPFIL